MEELKKQLLEEEQDLEKQLAIYKSEDSLLATDQNIANTFEDDVTDAEVHDRIVAIRSELKRRRAEVREALAKIDKGTYGVCDSCGKKIGKDRLAAFPSAEFCFECEQKRK
ncbi:MAG: hypothetical protein A2Z24_00065 [Candidatus Woykebacteria bacterium RBG_16_44_10]|uniref:Zinc finger DksA/TraR C4-type domain-containing protein n=1 Tax=Candidatus Woykebacteria bacterium RBG_16_44_10 TaxID=1802597 RepID=A0A1G1WF33_9BACT|nr:MAG: hypothetical protein A2Z24_00065 [Candidatus Woykebacteria bacterium RBG_16_44_10]